MRATWLAAASLVMLVATGIPQTPAIADGSEGPEVAQEQEAAARRGLEVFRAMTQRKSFAQSLGLDAPAQASDLRLGPPLQAHWVRLDRLQQFRPGNDAEKLLEPVHEIIYPIIAREQLAYSTTVSFSGVKNNWEASGWSPADLLRRLDQLEQYKTSKSSFLVKIPALNLIFLGDRLRGQLMLIPIADSPRFNFKAGQTLPAEDVFEKLVSAAKSRDNRPG